jgi:hypothetical protein
MHTVAEMAAFYQSPASADLRAAVHAAGERLGKGTRAERAQAKAGYKAALNAIRDALAAIKAA